MAPQSKHKLAGDAVEGILSITLAAILLCSLNPGLAVLAACPIIAAISMVHRGAWMNVIASAAFVVILGQVALGAFFANAPNGTVPLVFSMHF